MLDNLNEQMVPLHILEAIKSSWCADSTYVPESYIAMNIPSWGQCTVTALVLQDYMGGEIVRVESYKDGFRLTSHYFNRFPTFDIDITRNQFENGTYLFSEELRDRKVLLESWGLSERYKVLSEGTSARMSARKAAMRTLDSLVAPE